jgi:hypothetical protein
VVAGAPAQIAGHRLADFLIGGRLGGLNKRRQSHDEARRTITALQRMLVDEGLLQQVLGLPASKALDRHDTASVALRSECQARKAAFTVNFDRAATTGALGTADMDAERSKFPAQDISEQSPRLNVQSLGNAIDG